MWITLQKRLRRLWKRDVALRELDRANSLAMMFGGGGVGDVPEREVDSLAAKGFPVKIVRPNGK